MFTPESIKELRKDLGLSVLEFAQQVGVDRQAVYQWERGETHPNYRRQERLNALSQRVRIAKVG